MEASRRRQILELLIERVSAIKQSEGFETDAGFMVMLGETVVLGEEDPPVAIAIVVEPDQPTYTGEQVAIILSFELQALAKVDINQPYLAAEQVLADIKRAVELSDRRLGGLLQSRLERGPTRTIPREPGSTTAGVAVQYRAVYAEKWGNP